MRFPYAKDQVPFKFWKVGIFRSAEHWYAVVGFNLNPWQ
jgi:hypothetical protein